VIEIEQLTKTYAWALDAKDRELYWSVFSDDIRLVGRAKELSYILTGIEELRAATDFIFSSEKGAFSAISNLLVEIKGDTATGRDYYQHYSYRVNWKTGEVDKEPTLARGRHLWEFRKQDGVWKITRMESREHCPTYPDCDYAPFTTLPISK
jgi:ketosteroid isomerase-like protein